MNAPVGYIGTAESKEHLNLKEGSSMKMQNQIAKWINGNAPVKMVAGVAMGAMLMTAIALPNNAFADTPKRPMTSEEQLVIMAEIEDGFYETVALTQEQQLLVRAEIEDGVYNTGSLTPEQQLVVRAEIEDGALGIEDYNRGQSGVSGTGAVRVLQAVLSHDEGSYFSEEEWVQIMGELDDELR